MGVIGTNSLQMRTYNQAVVLDSIRRAGKISRVEIAQSIGLSAQTITNITRRLIEAQLVEESGKTQSNNLGKPRTLLQLRSDGRYAVGVHLDPAYTTVSLLDLGGNVIQIQRFATPSAGDPDHVIDIIAGAVRGIISQAKVPAEYVLGIGIGAPGPVDLEAGVVDSPPHLPKWNRVPLRDELARVTGLPVVLEKDVVTAAVAERWQAPTTLSETTVVVYVGTGIGVGSVSNGSALSGSSGNAGDVAHIVIDDSDDAEPCSCGRRGCVTVTASPTALIRRARKAKIDLPDGPSGEVLVHLFQQAKDGNEKAQKLITTAVIGLARMSLVVTDLYDPDRLVFGGPFWHLYADAFDEYARHILESAPIASAIHTVEIVSSDLGEDMGAIGAATVVLDQFLTPDATTFIFGERI